MENLESHLISNFLAILSRHYPTLNCASVYRQKISMEGRISEILLCLPDYCCKSHPTPAIICSCCRQSLYYFQCQQIILNKRNTMKIKLRVFFPSMPAIFFSCSLGRPLFSHAFKCVELMPFEMFSSVPET